MFSSPYSTTTSSAFALAFDDLRASLFGKRQQSAAAVAAPAKRSKMEVLRGLPQVQRAAYLLFVQGYEISEIAEKFQLSEKSVKKAIQRARLTLLQNS